MAPAAALLAVLAVPLLALNASKHHDADGPEYEAVVYIPRTANGGCTGALIAPRVVLTAAHCLRGFRPDAVYFGQAWARHRRVAVVDGEMHPSFPPGMRDDEAPKLDEPGSAIQDAAYLVLESDAHGVAPLPFSGAEPAPGETLHAVGYGGNSLGIRNWLDLAVLRRSDNPARLLASAGVLNGDSGGPGLRRAGGRLEVVAVASSLTAEGRWQKGVSRYALLGPALPWLRGRLGALLP